MNKKELDGILTKHGMKKSKVVAILQDVQDIYKYLPVEGLQYISERLGISLNEVYSIATFYRAFSLKPRGKNLITVCSGTACHVKGSPKIIRKIKDELGIIPGETSEDGLFTLETVNCLGACALGPLAVINGIYHGHMNTVKIRELIKNVKKTNG